MGKKRKKQKKGMEMMCSIWIMMCLQGSQWWRNFHRVEHSKQRQWHDEHHPSLTFDILTHCDHQEWPRINTCPHLDLSLVAHWSLRKTQGQYMSPSWSQSRGPLWVPSGSPSLGGDVVAYVKDINQSSLPTLFFLFLCLFLSLWLFQLYFIS